jgi:hypothetical protein
MTTEKRNRARRIAATGAIVLGLAAGSYGVAAAASGSSNGSSSTGTTPQSAPAGDPQNPWGPQRSDETLLTGDTLAHVKAAALGESPERDDRPHRDRRRWPRRL